MPPTTAPGFARPQRTAVVHEARAEHTPKERYAWALARMALGWVFLWAFLDKLFGLGFSTAPARAWLAGGSPTRGFLSGSTGPLAGLYQGLAGNPVVDVVFMAGLLAIGLALLLGVGLRIAAVSGSAMLLLMWSAAPPRTNPFMDDHIVYAIVLFGLAWARAGQTWGLGERWARSRWAQRWPWLT